MKLSIKRRKKRNNAPAVSFIIASYTSDTFLYRCIRSILRSRLQTYEVIAVIDGVDMMRYQNVLRHFNKHNTITIIVLEKNVGAAKARNIGAAKARGDYLFFLDDDTKIKTF